MRADLCGEKHNRIFATWHRRPTGRIANANIRTQRNDTYIFNFERQVSAIADSVRLHNVN